MPSNNLRELLLHDKLLSFSSSDSHNRNLSSSAFQAKIRQFMAKGFSASHGKVEFVSSIKEFLCHHHHPVRNKRNICPVTVTAVKLFFFRLRDRSLYVVLAVLDM